MPDGSFETADALIFFVKDKETAIKCRENLLLRNLTTKILPEAYNWHFAGTWTHIKQLNSAHKYQLINEFSKSKNIISKAVSLPINLAMTTNNMISIKEAIAAAL